MYETNDGVPAVIVAHSLGCLMMSTFFSRQSEEWKSKYVDSYMSIAGVYAGALKVSSMYLLWRNKHKVQSNLSTVISGSGKISCEL